MLFDSQLLLLLSINFVTLDLDPIQVLETGNPRDHLMYSLFLVEIQVERDQTWKALKGCQYFLKGGQRVLIKI